jgi:hypothetical protein
VTVEGDSLRVTKGPSRAGIAFFGAAALFGLYVLLTRPAGWAPLHKVPLYFGIMGLLTYGLLFVRRELVLSATEIRRDQRSPFGTRTLQVLSPDDVEEVAITNPPNSNSGKVVEVVTEQEALRFGRSLSAEELRWVRDCVLAVLSR